MCHLSLTWRMLLMLQLNMLLLLFVLIFLKISLFTVFYILYFFCNFCFWLFVEFSILKLIKKKIHSMAPIVEWVVVFGGNYLYKSQHWWMIHCNLLHFAQISATTKYLGLTDKFIINWISFWYPILF